jgi:polyphosphate kinase
MPPPPPSSEITTLLRTAAPAGTNTTAFFNRDLSWLDFNRRVLHEAMDPRTPLLERVKFLAIYSSNSDEFFMKRIGLLRRKLAQGSSSITRRCGSALVL